MPICNTCSVDKPLSDFTPNRWTKSGHTNKCKPCCNVAATRWRNDNLDKVRARYREAHRKERARTGYKRPQRTTEEGRLCSTCKTRKMSAEFGMSSITSDGIATRCKACTRESTTRYRYKDLSASRIRERDKARRRYARDPQTVRDGVRKSRLRVRYDLSLEGRANMLAAQDGKCAICKMPITLPNGTSPNSHANIDHDHLTGQVRELLCPPCNKGLGCFCDSPERLRAAALYLEKHA